MFRRQIGADKGLEPRQVRRLGIETRALVAQLIGENVRQEVLFRGEVGVERAVGQAGIGHHGRDACTVDAVFFETPPGRFDDSLPCGLLVVLAVAHAETSQNWFTSVPQRTACLARISIILRS